MADSNITKRALANALKELMEEMPFEKINVAQICEKCDMNRKSFYYHFRDKYDLVNWIFDIEFISILTTNNILDVDIETRFKTFDVLCDAFYKNRRFYRKAFKIKGQNSFSEHFRESIHPIISKRIETYTGFSNNNDIVIDFFSDACICAFERWLSDKNCMPPDEFSNLLKNIITNSALTITNEIRNDT